jgi:hypothetical protein
MLGILHALREWRGVLLSSPHKTSVYTDHIGLKFFKLPQNLSYRHARWSVELVDFNMEIAYVKGSHNTIADALSRSPILDPEDLEQDKVVTLLPKDLWLPDSDVATIGRIIEDRDERISLLRNAHDHILAGHPGIAQTIRNLKPHSWIGQKSDVTIDAQNVNVSRSVEIIRQGSYTQFLPLPILSNEYHWIIFHHYRNPMTSMPCW